jgi:glycosyltransferase involved in cell wall biosynthesis
LPVLREIVGESVLYFDQNNKTSIAEVMAKIISDRSLREDLKNRGLSRVKDFSWQKCAQETLREIENC